jgi:hypothetical protein
MVRTKIVLLVVFSISIIYATTLGSMAKMSENLIMNQNNKIGVEIVSECEVTYLNPIEFIFNCLLPLLVTGLFFLLAVFRLKNLGNEKRLDIQSHQLRHKSPPDIIISTEAATEMDILTYCEDKSKDKVNITERFDNAENSKNMIFAILTCFLITHLPKVIVFLIQFLTQFEFASLSKSLIQPEHLSTAHCLVKLVTYADCCLKFFICIFFQAYTNSTDG